MSICLAHLQNSEFTAAKILSAKKWSLMWIKVQGLLNCAGCDCANVILDTVAHLGICFRFLLPRGRTAKPGGTVALCGEILLHREDGGAGHALSCHHCSVSLGDSCGLTGPQVKHELQPMLLGVSSALPVYYSRKWLIKVCKSTQ